MEQACVCAYSLAVYEGVKANTGQCIISSSIVHNHHYCIKYAVGSFGTSRIKRRPFLFSLSYSSPLSFQNRWGFVDTAPYRLLICSAFLLPLFSYKTFALFAHAYSLTSVRSFFQLYHHRFQQIAQIASTKHTPNTINNFFIITLCYCNRHNGYSKVLPIYVGAISANQSIG